MSKTSEYYLDIYAVTRMIPKGRVTSYGAIAGFLGLPSARMVGTALNQCPKQVPAHRVVNRNGVLTGAAHFKPPSEMSRRLRIEGVKVKKDQVQDFKRVFWDPSLELKDL